MEGHQKLKRAHALVIPLPATSHTNPMFQFSKRLVSKGLRVTFLITTFISKTNQFGTSLGSVHLDTFSDGFDDGGRSQAASNEAYLSSLHSVGPKSLFQVVKRYQSSENPITCVIYEPFLSWAVGVAKQFGLAVAAFFTHMCAVNYVFYLFQRGLLELPEDSSGVVSVRGLPPLLLKDLPLFVVAPELYPANVRMTMSQFENLDEADYVLVNSFYKLEPEPTDEMSKVCTLLTIGPTIPSIYLGSHVENDNDYNLNLTEADPSTCTNWLNTKPTGSVLYVSFGTIPLQSQKQMEEVAWGLKKTNFYFLWVVKDAEEAHLPKGYVEDVGDKGLVVKWSPQLKVLANEAIGCFFTHCGWNSTIEALSIGVPMVTMPRWSDQQTNSKFVEDVWKVGIWAKADENGIVMREEIEFCVKAVMEGKRREEMRKNCAKWKELASEAVGDGGTSEKNINKFVSKLTCF